MKPWHIPEWYYESPVEVKETKRITRIVNDIHDSLEEQIDNKIISEIRLAVDVDKDELIKALAYDRDQFNKGFYKGFEAGYEQAMAELSIGEDNGNTKEEE